MIPPIVAPAAHAPRPTMKLPCGAMASSTFLPVDGFDFPPPNPNNPFFSVAGPAPGAPATFVSSFLPLLTLNPQFVQITLPLGRGVMHCGHRGMSSTWLLRAACFSSAASSYRAPRPSSSCLGTGGGGAVIVKTFPHLAQRAFRPTAFFGARSFFPHAHWTVICSATSAIDVRPASELNRSVIQEGGDPFAGRRPLYRGTY